MRADSAAFGAGFVVAGAIAGYRTAGREERGDKSFDWGLVGAQVSSGIGAWAIKGDSMAANRAGWGAFFGIGAGAVLGRLLVDEPDAPKAGRQPARGESGRDEARRGPNSLLPPIYSPIVPLWPQAPAPWLQQDEQEPAKTGPAPDTPPPIIESWNRDPESIERWSREWEEWRERQSSRPQVPPRELPSIDPGIFAPGPGVEIDPGIVRPADPSIDPGIIAPPRDPFAPDVRRA